MAATDKQKGLPAIVVPASASADGQRANTQMDNNKRTERINMRVRGQVDITVAGTGLANRGSILGAITTMGFSDGGTDKVQCDARLLRFIDEAMAPSALPATRLAAAGVQAGTILDETVTVWLAAPRTIQPNETKYAEVNKQLALQPFITPNRVISAVAKGATGTITNLSVSVEQLYDDLVNTPPWLTIYQRQIVQDVTGSNPALKVDLRGSRFIRGLAIQQDTDQGEVSDIINGIVLRGDSFSLYGDRPISFADLYAHQADEIGGALPPGYLWIDFARYGRLSTMWNPYQDTNLRFELDVQPSLVAGATGSKVRVAVVEYERTAVTADPLPINI